MLSLIACSAVLAISSVASTAAIASTVNDLNTQSSQSTQSGGTWVEVVRYIPVYLDGELIGYIVHTTWVYTMEP